MRIEREEAQRWISAHGFDPNQVRAASIRIEADLVPRLDVTYYQRDEQGRLGYPSGSDEPLLVSATVPLRSLPTIVDEPEQAPKVLPVGGPRNKGHGHVSPRLDGTKARCGGPALCSTCAAELAREQS